MKKWGDRLITTVGILLILTAVYMFAKPSIQHYFAVKDNEKKVEKYERRQRHHTSTAIPKDKTKMVGYISVPDADIKTPVYPGPATPNQLDRGVSFAEGNESLNDQNIAIAGHTVKGSSDYQFSSLPKVHKGSKVYFNVGNEKRTYKITKVFDVQPDDVQVLDEQDTPSKQLTLITCDNYNEQKKKKKKRKIFIAKEI